MDAFWDVRARLKQRALALPEAAEAHPWGKDVVKVATKVFAFFGSADDVAPRVGVKLPTSAISALRVAGAVPASHGLGRHHWITVPISSHVDEDTLLAWIVESYRAVAPARVSEQLDEAGQTSRRDDAAATVRPGHARGTQGGQP